jgi:hypothetical protein
VKIEIEQGKYNGHVILPEFLNILQVRKFEDSLGDIDAGQADEENKRIWLSVSDERRLPVLFDIVEEWHIEGIPEEPAVETFPMTPLTDAHAVIDKIYGGILKLWTGEQVPND